MLLHTSSYLLTESEKSQTKTLRQGWGFRFSLKDRTFEANKLFIIWLFARFLQAVSDLWGLRQNDALQLAIRLRHKNEPHNDTIYHKNYNFLDWDWFKKLLFSTNSLVKLLSDSLLSDSSISQSHPKLWFKSTNHILSCHVNQPITTLVLITVETV